MSRKKSKFLKTFETKYLHTYVVQVGLSEIILEWNYKKKKKKIDILYETKVFIERKKKKNNMCDHSLSTYDHKAV